MFILKTLLLSTLLLLPSCSVTGPIGPIGEKEEQRVDGLDGKDDIDGKDGKDGISIVSILKTSSNGLIDTYTITYSNGKTTTFNAVNGKQGDKGEPGKDAPHSGEKCTVTFHLNGGFYLLEEESIAVDWGDTINLPQAFKLDYTFVGWFTGETVNDRQFYNCDAVFSNIDLYARWKENDYSIELNLNGGTYDGPLFINVRYGEQYNLPSTGIVKEGFAFKGWYNGSTRWKYSDVFEYGSDVVLAAKWEHIITYNLIVDFNGGDCDASSNITKTNREIYTDDSFLPVPNKTNYQFMGYYNLWNQVTDSNGRILNTENISSVYNNQLIARYAGISDEYIGDFCYFGKYPQRKVTSYITGFLDSASDVDDDGYLELEDKEYINIGYNYFEVEPILWRVNENNLLIADVILDVCTFFKSDYIRTIQGNTVYPNNYEYSNVRAYLNGYDGSSYDCKDYRSIGFYDIAFSDEEKTKIQTSIVENGPSSIIDGFDNGFCCRDTQNKVFLISRNELITYMSSSVSEFDCKTTSSDYSVEMGLINYSRGYSSWALRSPGSRQNEVLSIFYNGEMESGYVGIDTPFKGLGIRPALYLR